MRKILSSVVFLFLMNLCIAEEIIFSETFQSCSTLEDAGFRKTRDNQKDQFSISGKELNLVFQNSPYKGTSYIKKTEIPDCGELNFELKTNSASGYNNFSLQIKFGMLNTGFRDYQWRVLNRKTGKWVNAGKMKLNRYHKFRIRYHAAKHYAEYYVDDMENPFLVDENSDIASGESMEFTIANYGLASGTIQYSMRKVELKKLDPAFFSATTSEVPKGTWIFYGMGYENWRLAELETVCPPPVAKFILNTVGAHPGTTPNNYSLEPQPPVKVKQFPARIVFADMPLRPIPPYARNTITEAVKNGASLLILNGYFTLNKGDFYRSEFSGILPLDLSDPWGGIKVTGGKRGRCNTVFSEYGKGNVGIFLNKKLMSEQEFKMIKAYLKGTEK